MQLDAILNLTTIHEKAEFVHISWEGKNLYKKNVTVWRLIKLVSNCSMLRSWNSDSNSTRPACFQRVIYIYIYT